jgi:hypothetical protein
MEVHFLALQRFDVSFFVALSTIYYFDAALDIGPTVGR